MMTRSLTWLGATLFLGASALAGQSAPTLTVSHQARRLEPGEAVVLAIASTAPLKEVRATAFGRGIPIAPDDAPGSWRGLFGIDVETKAGRYEIVVDGLTVDGAALHARHALVVSARKFPIRQLSVDDAFVNPPSGVRARIEAEAKAVEAVLAKVSPAPRWPVVLVRPVPGEATSGFGRRSVLNGEVRSIHAGVDFRAAEGTPVKAPARGRVALAADHYFAGKLVIVEHGLGLFSFLAHLSSLSVAEGQEVEPGQVVGLSGATGRVTGPHLHWSIRLPGARVDPLSLMAVFEVESRARGVVR